MKPLGSTRPCAVVEEHVGLVQEYTGVGERGSVDSLLQELDLVGGGGAGTMVDLSREWDEDGEWSVYTHSDVMRIVHLYIIVTYAHIDTLNTLTLSVPPLLTYTRTNIHTHESQ